jgi:SAM-dependent methyltransferase
MPTAKRYDRGYFERFYQDPATRVLEPGERRRRVAAVVALAELHLGRALRSALDVGCGAALWGRELVRLRPALRYLGVDPAAAAVELAPRGLDVRRLGVEALDRLAPARFDLVICADVLHYLDAAAVRAALPALVRRARGPLYLELLTSAERVEGDRRALRRRAPAWYLRRFASAGLRAAGLHLYLPKQLAEKAAALELGRTPPRPQRRGD